MTDDDDNDNHDDTHGSNDGHNQGNPGRHSRRVFLKTTGAVGITLATPWLPLPAAAATGNAIQAENARTGDTGWWLNGRDRRSRRD